MTFHGSRNQIRHCFVYVFDGVLSTVAIVVVDDRILSLDRTHKNGLAIQVDVSRAHRSTVAGILTPSAYSSDLWCVGCRSLIFSFLFSVISEELSLRRSLAGFFGCRLVNDGQSSFFFSRRRLKYICNVIAVEYFSIKPTPQPSSVIVVNYRCRRKRKCMPPKKKEEKSNMELRKGKARILWWNTSRVLFIFSWTENENCRDKR